MVISGEKPVQDMVMVEWKVYKKEIKMMGFTKAFVIPDGVIIDRSMYRTRTHHTLLNGFPTM